MSMPQTFPLSTFPIPRGRNSRPRFELRFNLVPLRVDRYSSPKTETVLVTVDCYTLAFSPR